MQRTLLSLLAVLFTLIQANAQELSGTYTHNPAHPTQSDITIEQVEDAAGGTSLSVSWSVDGETTTVSASACESCARYENDYAAGMEIVATYKLTYELSEQNVTCYLICTAENNGSYSFMKVEEMVEDMAFTTHIYQLTSTD